MTITGSAIGTLSVAFTPQVLFTSILLQSPRPTKQNVQERCLRPGFVALRFVPPHSYKTGWGGRDELEMEGKIPGTESQGLVESREWASCLRPTCSSSEVQGPGPHSLLGPRYL